MCNSALSLPKYEQTETQFGKTVSVRLTEKTLESLPVLCKATNSPTVAAMFRMLITYEHQLILDGLRKPEDYIPTDNKPKVKVQNIPVSEAEYKILFSIKDFYQAPTMTGTVNHMLMAALATLSTKEGE